VPHEFTYDEARRIALAEFTVEKDGSVATRPRAATHPGAHDNGLYCRIPERFQGLV
jgi:hypothetical protein